MNLVLRPEVEAFAQLMEYKLQQNEWKGTWKYDSAYSLNERVKEEMQEFQCAMQRYPTKDKDIAYEAADVTNMLMMVLDVKGVLQYQ